MRTQGSTITRFTTTSTLAYPGLQLNHFFGIPPPPPQVAPNSVFHWWERPLGCWVAGLSTFRSLLLLLLLRSNWCCFLVIGWWDVSIMIVVVVLVIVVIVVVVIVVVGVLVAHERRRDADASASTQTHARTALWGQRPYWIRATLELNATKDSSGWLWLIELRFMWNPRLHFVLHCYVCALLANHSAEGNIFLCCTTVKAEWVKRRKYSTAFLFYFRRPESISHRLILNITEITKLIFWYNDTLTYTDQNCLSLLL